MFCSAALATPIGGRERNALESAPTFLMDFPIPSICRPGNSVTFTAETACEIAECRVPSTARLEPKLITPADVATSLRGGGNVSRQIVDIMTPAFPADKLIVIEVYTPGGNWSSFPPHKHDVHNPPAEVDLDEIYYYRMKEPGAFALQHLYSGGMPAGRPCKPTMAMRSGPKRIIIR